MDTYDNSCKDTKIIGLPWISIDDEDYGIRKFVLTLDKKGCIGKEINGYLVPFLSDDEISIIKRWGFNYLQVDEVPIA